MIRGRYKPGGPRVQRADAARNNMLCTLLCIVFCTFILYSLRTLCNRYDSNWLNGSGRARRLGAGVITSRLTLAARAADSKAALGIWCAAVQARTGSQALPVRFSTRAFVLRTLRGSQETLIDVQNNTRDYAIQHRAGGEACGPCGPYRGNGVGGPGALRCTASGSHFVLSVACADCR